MLPAGKLFISSVTWSDVGVYRCVAVNPLTASQRVSPSYVNLLVQGLHWFFLCLIFIIIIVYVYVILTLFSMKIRTQGTVKIVHREILVCVILTL